MPIGKDSITKRVAKVEPQAAETPNIAPELVATTAAAPKKTPAKKTSTTKAATTKTTTAKATTSKKPASTTKKAPAKKAEAPKEAAAEVATNVLSNVAPETVEAVIGHKENTKFDTVKIGDELPIFLM